VDVGIHGSQQVCSSRFTCDNKSIKCVHVFTPGSGVYSLSWISYPPFYPSCLLFLVRLGDYIVNLWLLILQTHRETDRFFTLSGVQLPETNGGLLLFLRTVFSSQLKTKVGITLPKTATLRLNLNIDGEPIPSRTHTHPSHISSINFVILFRCSSSPTNPVYVRRVDSSTLVFSLSSYRHSYIGFVYISCIDLALSTHREWYWNELVMKFGTTHLEFSKIFLSSVVK
jgi:hypothetical protein